MRKPVSVQYFETVAAAKRQKPRSRKRVELMGDAKVLLLKQLRREIREDKRVS